MMTELTSVELHILRLLFMGNGTAYDERTWLLHFQNELGRLVERGLIARQEWDSGDVTHSITEAGREHLVAHHNAHGIAAASLENHGVLAEIDDEMRRQFAKWGPQAHDPGRWMIILIEEVGEVAEAAYEGFEVDMRKELVQVAAVAASWLKYFDEMPAK